MLDKKDLEDLRRFQEELKKMTVWLDKRLKEWEDEEEKWDKLAAKPKETPEK